MRPFARIGLPAALAALGLAAAAVAQVQNPAARPESRLVGKVNDEPITEKELVELLGQFVVPKGGEQRAYDAATELLVNTKLLEQFLRASAPPVQPAEVQQVVDQYAQQLRQQGGSLEAALADSNTTPEEFRARISRSLQWKNFVTGRAGDAELASYIQANADVFAGTQVKASHILLKLPEGASDAQKAEARGKLESIKKEIESGSTSFAEAANKHSEDERNLELKNGGDLELFPRKGAYIEPFSAAAFALKGKPLGAVSDPVETEYGLHLIQLTEIKEGRPVDPKAILASPQDKQVVLNQYAAELQEKIVEAQRARARVDLQPMPADFFQRLAAEAPPQPRPVAAPAPAANGAPGR